MNNEIKNGLKMVFEECQKAQICKEKPSFASIVFAYHALTHQMVNMLENYSVSDENVEDFLRNEAPVSRVIEPLINLEIIEDYSDNSYPYWINYVGDFVAEQIIKEANKYLGK